MRLPSYQSPPRARQRAFVRLTRALGGELDDVGKVCLRRPDFFGRPFLQFAHSLLRGPSTTWSVGERELFAAVVSRANSCQFCVGTHAEIAALELGRDALTRLDRGAMTPRASAAAAFAEALTRDSDALSATVARARAAGVKDDALAEVAYVVFMFSAINRIVDALGFEHRSDRHRRRGAAVLRRIGYRLPAILEADEGDGPGGSR